VTEKAWSGRTSQLENWERDLKNRVTHHFVRHRRIEDRAKRTHRTLFIFLLFVNGAGGLIIASEGETISRLLPIGINFLGFISFAASIVLGFIDTLNLKEKQIEHAASKKGYLYFSELIDAAHSRWRADNDNQAFYETLCELDIEINKFIEAAPAID
jgi:hypothetical protein